MHRLRDSRANRILFLDRNRLPAPSPTFHLLMIIGHRAKHHHGDIAQSPVPPPLTANATAGLETHIGFYAARWGGINTPQSIDTMSKQMCLFSGVILRYENDRRYRDNSRCGKMKKGFAGRQRNRKRKRGRSPFFLSAESREFNRLMFGAGNEARTRDLNLGKVALYQLSYSRITRTD